MKAIYHETDWNAELSRAHDSLFIPVTQELPTKETASRALLRQIGIADKTSTDWQLLEYELSNKMMNLHAHSFSSASSADESLRSILDTNNTGSQLLSLDHLGTTSAVGLDNNLRALDDKIGLLKGTGEITDVIRVAEGRTQSQFLNRWAGSASS
jgi:hypothetical protein